jgi:hypothetical protein
MIYAVQFTFMAIPHEELQQEQYLHTYQEIVQQIMGHENAYFFFKPVDPIADGAPDYCQIIVTPMSILTVQGKLDRREYTSPDEFIADMRQIWANAKIYNHQSHTIYKTAHALAEKFEILAASLPHEISQIGRCSALQRAVELRLGRYRMAKKTHK